MKCGAILWGLLLLLACGGEGPVRSGGPVAEWRSYAGSPGGQHYSPLAEISTPNAANI